MRIYLIEWRNRLVLLCGAAVLAAAIGFFTQSNPVFMLQIGLLIAFFIPAAVLSLRDHAALVPYIVGCWVFSPELRRIVDWAQGEYTQLSLILILPHIVTCALVFSIMKNRANRSLREEFKSNKFYPFIIAAYAYATLLGLILNKIAGMYDMIGYLAPALIAPYFFLRPFTPAELNKMIRICVSFALLVSIYGWIQYLTLPAWDAFWIENANMTSIGNAAPLDFRMFSTMTSQGPVAVFLGTMLVIMIVNKEWRGKWGWIGVMLVASALSITLVRSAWVTLILGLIGYIACMDKGKKISKIITIIVIGACFYAVISKLPGAENVTARLETFQNMGDDNSFRARIGLVIDATPVILKNPLGGGFGSVGRGTVLGDGTSFAGLGSLDNGYLGVFAIFGVVGGLAFFIGIYLLFRYLLAMRHSDIKVLAIATIIQLLVAFFFGGGLQAYQGVLFWLFVSMALAQPNPKEFRL
ncbi:O-antigen ligase family protein [Paenibacillus sp. NPDC058174]|uniref:O-antigen ligase family protein n=1 Tax=Paenibacillus sp. NPDC058174 TaxID=3346366 RepID=UPI0036D8553B